MKYLSVFAAIIAVWIAILCVAMLPQTTDSRFGIYEAGLACTAILFIIGFWKRV